MRRNRTGDLESEPNNEHRPTQVRCYGKDDKVGGKYTLVRGQISNEIGSKDQDDITDLVLR
jgi:hypothetical protein